MHDRKSGIWAAKIAEQAPVQKITKETKTKTKTKQNKTNKQRKIKENEQHWSAEPSAQARCVWFCCLCKVCSRVSEALLLALQTLSLSFITNNSSSRLFYVSLRPQAPQQQYTASSQCEGMATVTNWPLHMHYGITPHAPTRVITHLPLRTVCGNIACEENGWLSAIAVSL